MRRQSSCSREFYRPIVGSGSDLRVLTMLAEFDDVFSHCKNIGAVVPPTFQGDIKGEDHGPHRRGNRARAVAGDDVACSGSLGTVQTTADLISRNRRGDPPEPTDSVVEQLDDVRSRHRGKYPQGPLQQIADVGQCSVRRLPPYIAVGRTPLDIALSSSVLPPHARVDVLWLRVAPAEHAARRRYRTVSRPSWRRYRKSSAMSAQSWNQLKSSLPGFGRSTQRSINWTRIRRRTRLRSKRL